MTLSVMLFPHFSSKRTRFVLLLNLLSTKNLFSPKKSLAPSWLLFKKKEREDLGWSPIYGFTMKQKCLLFAHLLKLHPFPVPIVVVRTAVQSNPVKWKFYLNWTILEKQLEHASRFCSDKWVSRIREQNFCFLLMIPRLKVVPLHYYLFPPWNL